MDKPEQYGNINWLPEDEYAKLVGQTGLKLNGVLSCFKGYGHDVFIPEAAEQIIGICENFGLKVRGVDKPIVIKPRHGEYIQ